MAINLNGYGLKSSDVAAIMQIVKDLSTGATATVPFSTSLAYDAPYVVAALQPVTGPLTFTKNVANAAIGGGTDISLAADGVNVPNFSALGLLVGSGTYVNTAGTINTISTALIAGGQYVYTIAQTGTYTAPVYAPNAPTGLTASAITGSGYTVTFTPSTTDSSHSVATSYTAKIRHPSGSGAYTSLGTVTSPFNVTGESVSTNSGVVVTAVNSANTTDSAEISTTTAASSLSILRLSTYGVTESGDGTAGWNYLGVNQSVFSSDCTVSQLAMAGLGSVQFGITLNAAGSPANGGDVGLLMGFSTDSTTGQSSNDYQTYADGGAMIQYNNSSVWQHRGTSSDSATLATANNNDLVRVSRIAGNFLRYEYSHDNGTTWTTLRTGTTAVPGTLYFHTQMCLEVRINIVKSVGMA